RRGGHHGRRAKGARRGRHRGGATARHRDRRVLLCLRHRDGRGPGEVLRPGRDDVDARQRARVPRPTTPDHRGADPGRGPQVSDRERRHARAVPAEGCEVMRRLVALVLAVALLAPWAATAQAPGDGVTATKLDNGLTVMVRENPVAPVVAVALLLRMGSRWENPSNAGISNFTHAVMVKGTTKRSGGDLADAVASLGGKTSAAGAVKYSRIQGTA